MGAEYLFTSARLGFRNWQHTDIAALAAINADPVVRQFFPGVQSYEQTAAFVARMQQMMAAKGYCYFAVDKLDGGACIGFTGIADVLFDAPFTPCTDIGWRLSSSEWGHGYATEAARRCLAYAFEELHLPTIHAIAPAINKRSIHIMEKIGMQKAMEFVHPLLAEDERLRDCVLYEVHRK